MQNSSRQTREVTPEAVEQRWAGVTPRVDLVVVQGPRPGSRGQVHAARGIESQYSSHS